MIIEAHRGRTVEDDVRTGEELLHVSLADAEVTVIEICINGSDLLMHIWTNFFDFFKQLKHRHKPIHKDYCPHHIVLIVLTCFITILKN